MRRISRLLPTFLRAGQHHIANPQLTFGETKEQSTGTDFDVVWMRTYGEQGQRLVCRSTQGQWQHDIPRYIVVVASAAVMAPLFAPDRSGSHIIQGQSPRWYISSSCARSLTVSAGDQ